jgi:GxxExxY protein
VSREEHPHQELTEKVIGLAMKVHRALGPGLLESAYEACLAFELEESGFDVRRQVPVDLLYSDRLRIESAYRMDLVVNGTLVLELKTVEKIIPAHEAQVFTYLRFSKLPVALILNFWVWPLKEGGIKRVLLPRP